MTFDEVNKTTEKNNAWYVTDEKFHTYWIWRGLFNSNDNLQYNKKFTEERKQSIYLKKQIIINYFKNFFLFPVWLLRLLTPWYLKGQNNAWTNLKTILRSREFKPLRFALLSQMVFLVCIGYFTFYKYSQLTRATGDETLLTDIFEQRIVVPSAESYTKLQAIKKQIYLVDQDVNALDQMSKNVNEKLDYDQIVNLVVSSQDILKDLENNVDLYFTEQSSSDVNDLFVRIVNNKIRQELILDRLAVNVSVLLASKAQDFDNLQSNMSMLTRQLLASLIIDDRFVSSKPYFEKVKHVMDSLLSINRGYLLSRTDLVIQSHSGEVQAIQKLEELDSNFQNYYVNDLGIVFNAYTQEDALDFGKATEGK